MEILLFAAIIILFILAYKIKLLKEELKSTLHKSEADSKILFLNSRYASMGETVGNIAHQWKQPLNAIASIQNSIKAALIFQGEISKEKLLNSVETSFKLIQHLAETIDTFYSFLSHGNNTKMSFSVADEMSAIRKITEYSFENSNITLNCILDANPTIQGNANEFTHSMLNLILNAKDAFDNADTEDAFAITVHISGGEKICTITVCDNAGGIRVEPIEMIFDLHLTTKEHGSGLGLFMTKNIIEKRFGGNISVKNNYDGACFTIELPYAQYDENFADIVTPDERLSLERINQLTHKIIELEEVGKTLRKWADIFKHAHWGIAIHVGTSNNFELTNAAFHTLYGYTTQELRSISVPDLFTTESLPMLSKIQNEAFEKGFVAFESTHKRKDGSIFPVSVELIVIKDDEGEILYHIANIWDLTEKKAAEERLLLKKFALDHIKDSVFMIDENANFHYVNEGACLALGYSREEFESMTVGDIDPDWPRERWPEHWNALKKVGSMTIELRHRRKDGTIFPVEVSANYIQFGDKHYNMAIARDITERQLLEQQKDNERMRLFFERQLVGMAITSPEKGWIHTNEKLQQMLGYTDEELMQLTWTEMTYPEDLAPDVEQFTKLLNDEIQDYMLEKRFIRKDGTIVYTNLAVSCVRNDDRSINYVLALLEDITEQKRIYEALALKEWEFRSLAENTPENIARWDSEGRYLYINPVQEDTLGISAAGVVGKRPSEAFPDSRFSESEKSIVQVATTGEPILFTRLSVPKKDGRVELHDVNLVPERDASGKIVSVLGIGRNMTYIYRLQDEIAAKEQELRSLADSSPGMMGAFYSRPDGSICMPYASPNISEIFGLEPQDVRDDATPLLALNHPDDAARVGESIAESARTMNIWHEEFRIIHPLKGERWMESNTKPELHPEGGIVWYGYVHDITKRKELETLLEKERKFLMDAQRVAHTGSWHLDIQHGVLSWSDETYRIFELEKEHVDDLHKTFYACVHPDDREMVNAPYLESLKTKLPYKIEHRIIMADGRIKYVVERCEHIYDNDNNPIFSIGTVQDVTERKKIESKLEESHSFLNRLIDSISDPIFVKDKKHIWVLLNKAFCDLIGQPREQLLGKSDYDIFPKEQADIFWDKDEEVFKSKKVNINEEYFTSVDGVTHCIETIKSMFVGSYGKEYLVGTIRDITERKEMEEALRELNERLEQKVKERTVQLQEAIITLYKEIDERKQTEKTLAESEQRYKEIFENTSDSIYLMEVTQDGRFKNITANPAFISSIGIPLEALVGSYVGDLTDEETTATVIAKYRRCIEAGVPTEEIAELDLPVGRKTFCSTLIPIKDESGRVCRIIGLAKDITGARK
ncbi:MAG: PAS domain S-box protein [Sulfuricurvum sp.]